MHARDWLFSLEAIGIKLGLSQIRALLTALDHPERAFRSITIAGTNGKGSVSALVERGLRAAGETTGRYTSPHLVHLEERVAINGQPIAIATADDLAERVRAAAHRLDVPPSFFEATTAMALLAFRDAGVTIAVLEVGLGGRLDATNAVDAPLVAITAIDLDHQEHLGHTLEAIAREKAGVIKPGATAIVGPNPPEVIAVIRAVAADVGAVVIDALSDVHHDAVVSARSSTVTLTTPLRVYPPTVLRLAGRHQITNAIIAARVLETALPDAPATMVTTAFAQVEWPARLEWLSWQGHEVLLDGAHNPAGALALASFVNEMVSHPVPIVVGVMRDKAATDIIAALAPVASVFVATAASSSRALPAADVAALCERTGRPTLIETDAVRAVSLAAAHGSPVVVAGSLYLAGQVRREICP